MDLSFCQLFQISSICNIAQPSGQRPLGKLLRNIQKSLAGFVSLVIIFSGIMDAALQVVDFSKPNKILTLHKIGVALVKILYGQINGLAFQVAFGQSHVRFSNKPDIAVLP